MKINKTVEEGKVKLALEGRLDAITSGELQAVLSEILESVGELTLDLTSLDYISSAGLRVVLGTQKQINAKKGKMIIKNVNETVMEVFQLTGFVDILTIE